MAQPISCAPVNLGEQFDQYYPAVFKYFRYRGADPDTANDLAAAVFERALAKINTFDPEKSGIQHLDLHHRAQSGHQSLESSNPVTG